MKSDRLLSILLLLQNEGRLSARQLAQELEVSERTIYRDIDSLSASGVPVYSESGPGGGYSLLDGFKTNLTALTKGEARALFMLSIPDALAELGTNEELKAALLKLSAAVPDPFRQDGVKVRQRFYLDSTWWQQRQQSVPHLETLDKAVWADQRIKIHYQLPLGLEVQQSVDPYGLVVKAGVWFLIYAANVCIRVHPVSGLTAVIPLEDPFERPASFDLAAFWKTWCAQREEDFSNYMVEVRVKEAMLPQLIQYFSERSSQLFQESEQTDAEGWKTLRLSFESLNAARACLLGFGSGVEIIEPLALRLSVIDFARQLLSSYEG